MPCPFSGIFLTALATYIKDEGSLQDFDDLMRSGTTMKVSLTPDRLKTFEVGFLFH